MKKDLDTIANLTHRPTAIDVIDRVLDKGIVVEYHVEHVALGGIGLPVTMDARCVVASLDTYLKYAKPLSKALRRKQTPGFRT